MEKAKVYFTKDISPEGLLKAYEALGVELKGKVAVKISTGEPGGHHFLQPSLIEKLVKKVNGTIVEGNTAYEGKRNTTKAHWDAIKAHGFMDIAACDIMDEDGQFAIPVRDGKHLKENYAGNHMKNYDSILMLSHFKGHIMGGFGGALKNMSIGLASSEGKAYIHGAGEPAKIWTADHDSFLESMAEADSAIVDFVGKENLLYVNVANKLSVDCDCDPKPHPPEMADIGIFASVDPVAVDKASIDAVYNSSDSGKAALIERIESRNGIHTVNCAEARGLGTTEYEIIDLDK